MHGEMQTVEGKEEYKKRGESVEWVFGNVAYIVSNSWLQSNQDIKQNIRLREFLTRGVEQVRREWNMACIAHNLKVMWGKLKGKVDILSDILRLEVESGLEQRKRLSYHAISDYLSHIRLKKILVRWG